MGYTDGSSETDARKKEVQTLGKADAVDIVDRQARVLEGVMDDL